jgi:hypothetical protein
VGFRVYGTDDNVLDFWHHIDSFVKANISEMHTISIFKAEVIMLPSITT